MTTLSQITLDFNRKIKLSNDGGALSSDTGQLVFKEFDEKIGFSKTVIQHLALKDSRKSPRHSNAQLFRQKLYQVLAGYSEDGAANQLTRDPVFTQIVGTPALASQPTLSRFFRRFDHASLEQLMQANQELLDHVHRHRQSQSLIIDLDSTHIDTYGHQEDTAFNAHYGTIGFHPLVAFDGVTGDFIRAQLRSGEVYTSSGVVPFIQPILTHYNETFPETTPFLRGDSGFAVPALYALCEKESVFYTIRLKANPVLQRMAEELHPSDTTTDQTLTFYDVIDYQAKSWDRPRKVVVQSVRPAGELLFTYTFVVTNLRDAFTPHQIFQVYQKRGTMENYIKEAKLGFSLDRMPSHDFQVNQVRLLFSLLAYNLTNWLRTLTFPDGQKAMRIETIRTRLVKVAGKVVKSGRALHFKLASSFVYQPFFWHVLHRIQKLQF